MAGRFRIKNWSKFQHYKERNPPWIKLHIEIFGSEDWVMLDDASRLLAIVCMVIAAKNDGYVPDNPDYIMRISYLKRRPNLKPLIECGFLQNEQADASESKQEIALARPEKEAEAEAEAEKESSSPRALRAEFEEDFWQACPKKVGKDAAYRAYAKARKTCDAEPLLTGMCRYAASRIGQDVQFTAHPASWLNAGRWNDEQSPQALNGSGPIGPSAADLARVQALEKKAMDERFDA